MQSGAFLQSRNCAITQLLRSDTDLLRKNWSSVTMQRTVAMTSNCKGLQRTNLLQQSARTREIHIDCGEIFYKFPYFWHIRINQA